MMRLIGDVGGTNTRLALVSRGTQWERMQSFRNDGFESLEDVVAHYLSDNEERPEAAAFAVAGPVRGGEATLTNRGWRISAQGLARRFDLDHCLVVNDFSGVALGVPALESGDLEQLGGEGTDARWPVAIVGPGTGLGVGGLVPGDDGGRVLVTEGGHATLAAADDRQAAIIARLRERFGHVSAERAVSGQGLENLYWAITALDGRTGDPPSAPRIGEAATDGTDPAAVEALDHFFRFLGAMAGDLALTYGAFGGVYIAGGIVPHYRAAFRRSGFRKQFESKGRMSDYVRPIPAFLILHDEVELLGLAASLDARAAGKPWPQV